MKRGERGDRLKKKEKRKNKKEADKIFLNGRRATVALLL